MNITCPHCSQTLVLTPEVHAQLQGQSHLACPTCQGLMAVPPMPAAAPKQAPRRPADVQKAAMHAQRGLNRNMLVLGVIALLALGGLAAFLASRNGGSVFNIFQNTTNQIIHNSYFTQLIASGVTTEKDLKSIGDIRPYGDGFIGISKEPLTWAQAQELSKRTGAEVLAIEDSAAGTRQQLTEWLNTTFASYLASTLWVRQDGQTRVLDKRDVMSVTSLDSPRKAVLQWKPSGGSTTVAPVLATKANPFINTLGMRFVPVGITGGPNDGKVLLFSTTETTKEQYRTYADTDSRIDRKWENLQFKAHTVSPDDSHPAVAISWDDASAFCTWLSKREGRVYRLPSSHEWDIAGGGEPPPNSGHYGVNNPKLASYPTTAPAAQFTPNSNGLFDMGGNVWEWCSDWAEADKKDKRVKRGGSFEDNYGHHQSGWVLASSRPTDHYENGGFRIVLEVAGQNIKAATPQSSAAVRSAAEWVLSKGGRLGVLVNGQTRDVITAAELPVDPLKVVHVHLDARAKAIITDQDLPRLAPLSDLVSLCLAAQKISDESLQHLSNFPKLETLDLNWCTELTGSGLQHVKSLLNLRTVSLRTVKMGDVAMEHLREAKNLESLDMVNMPLTRRGLQYLVEMKKLTTLNVGGVDAVSDETLALIKQLHEMTSFRANSDQITDAGLQHLKSLTKLELLELGSLRISGKGLETLAQIGSLKNLLLAGTAIQDGDLRPLQAMPSLTSLNLTECRLTDAAMPSLGVLTKLQGLSLAKTLVSNAGLDALHGLRWLKKINLSGTQVTDAGISKLQTAIPGLNVTR